MKVLVLVIIFSLGIVSCNKDTSKAQKKDLSYKVDSKSEKKKAKEYEKKHTKKVEKAEKAEKVEKSKKSCYLNGKKLYGKVKIVNDSEDIKVRRVGSGEDIRVIRKTDNGNLTCGEWNFVSSGEDLKIKFVSSGEDLKVKFIANPPAGMQ